MSDTEVVTVPDGYIFVLPVMPHTVVAEFLSFVHGQGCPATQINDDPTNKSTFIFIPQIKGRTLISDADTFAQFMFKVPHFAALLDEERNLTAIPICGDRFASDGEDNGSEIEDIDFALIGASAISAFVKATEVKRKTGSRVLRLGD